MGKPDAWIKKSQSWEEEDFDEFNVTKNFRKRDIISIPNNEAGHDGGDARLRKQIFNPDGKDPFRQAAGSRNGSVGILVGTAARTSIDSDKPIKIADLTSLKPGLVRV